LQRGVERTQKRGERLVNVVPKIFMDRAVLPPYLGDDLLDVGVETGMPLVGAAGYVCGQLLQRVRQVLFEVIHGRDLLGNFSQVVAFCSQGDCFPEHGGMPREDAAEKPQVGGSSEVTCTAAVAVMSISPGSGTDRLGGTLTMRFRSMTPP
jgi:hypothetical protein